MRKEREGKVKIEDFIKNVSADKLRKFIVTQAKYNTDLYNAVVFEFTSNADNTKGNKYSKLIQSTLATVPCDEDDYYTADVVYIDVLDLWIDKAKKCINEKHYDEAILICKAIIEEYSQWLYNIDENAAMVFSSDYQTIPFDIINEAAKHTDKKELYNYCLSEMKKHKYNNIDFYFYDEFQRLFENLAIKINL
jgi:hypothetical protein